VPLARAPRRKRHGGWQTRLSAFRFLYVPEASLKESFVARMERSESGTGIWKP
jgi:hypothetical protein